MRGNHGMPLRNRLLAALAVFGLGAAGKLAFAREVAALRDRERAALERPVAEFPARIGPWTRVRAVETNAKMLADIKSDGYLNAEYLHPSGERATLWINYSAKSYDQYHYPTVCLNGAGWEETENARTQLALGTAPAMRQRFVKQQDVQTVYYWYYLIGEDPVDRKLRELSKYARAFLRGRRNASLTVEVFSGSPNPRTESLDAFAAGVAKELSGWMPPGTEACCELGATY
jgi:EpsI family protein